MRDLEQICGLPIALDGEQLDFGAGIVVEEHGIRLLEALEPVVLEPEHCRGIREAAYVMDNGVYRKTDADRLQDVPMRYELTLIPPRQIGREYIKTFGHRHHPEPRSGIDYAEVCEVLVGKAHFIFQTLDLSGPSAPSAFCIEATAGQKVVFPPGFDHCTINPGPEPVLFSDVIARGVSGDYSRFTATRGAAYLEVEEQGAPAFIPNPTYERVAPLQEITPVEYPHLRLTDEEPLYTAFVGTRGELWHFLTDPRLFWSTFPDLKDAFSAA